jgi:hypothetical protein
VGYKGDCFIVDYSKVYYMGFRDGFERGMKIKDIPALGACIVGLFHVARICRCCYLDLDPVYGSKRQATPERDRASIDGLLSAALLMRLVLFIILQYLVFSKGMTDIFGDARDNIVQGTIFADYFRGEFDIGKVLSVDRYNTHSMSVFNGLYFLIFGRDIIFLKYSYTCDVAAGWLIYDFLGVRIRLSRAGCLHISTFLA